MINLTKFRSLFDLLRTFSTEQKCIKYLESIRWNNGVVSPFDSGSVVWKCKGINYRCKNTGKYFNVKTGTIFENTNISLKKWFMVIWIISSHKKGISSVQIAKDLGLTQKTAWFMLQRIRTCFEPDLDIKLSGEIEIDETYIGGLEPNKHDSKKIDGTQGRSIKTKVPVLGMVERGGRLKANVVENTTTKVITPAVVESVDATATVYTDEWQGYKGIDRIYNHLYVKHKEREFVAGRIYTNNIEGFWGILKRGIIGIYHSTSKKHLQLYVDEFVFRYNTRQDDENVRFVALLKNTDRRRITYAKLIA